MKPLFDKGLSKILSRKLLVWTTSTVALFLGVIDGEQWMTLCVVYIGSQAVADIVSTVKHGKIGE